MGTKYSRILNAPILYKYGIEFRVAKDSEYGKHLEVEQNVVTDVSFFLCQYFTSMSPEIFEEDVLPEIDRALKDEPFDTNGGGVYVFLSIGRETSILSGINKAEPPAKISTVDMKEIILIWIKWVRDNKLSQYIY
ncbi:MAG: hypothetical protein INR69_06690 [Mucilaginibacter polytrichastri]|nr:hypothetical protein [Mucilaginibacter polytrichastri]